MNNMTVDGSYFNNSFGLGSAPGERTNVAPISLESIEQMQVSVAPFDVRQGSFIGAAVNTVTRSGTNQLTASFYHRMRNEDFVGTEAEARPSIPARSPSATRACGGRADRQEQAVRLRQLRERGRQAAADDIPRQSGGEPVAGSVTSVLESDLTALSSFLKQNFRYDTGAFDGSHRPDSGQALSAEDRLNLTNNNKISFRYNQLDSSATTTSRARRRRGAAAPLRHRLSRLRRTPTTRFSRTSSRGSANGTR